MADNDAETDEAGASRARGGSKGLTRQAWCLAALERIAAGGTSSVSVEGLARELGVTKGSFYWHFSDRAALIEAALEHWAEIATHRLITELSGIDNPRERLAALFSTTFGDPRGGLDVMLATAVDDPVAGKMVRRVTAARLAFLETAYRDLGLDADSSRRHSLIAYATYLGHFQLVGALDNEWRSLCDEPGYLQQVLTTLEP